MSFKTIEIKSSYETGEDNLVESFYIPVLKNAVSYDRIAGFFSSSSLAIAARGIAGLVKNNGKIRLIACPRLNKDDIDVLKNLPENLEYYLENLFIRELGEIEDKFERDHIWALGWLLANNMLEIKIALVYNNKKLSTYNEIERNGIFHQKVGILKDSEGNEISFSGSINESASGWLNNIEEFKVFKEWILGQNEYFESDKNKFEDFWNNKRKNVTIVQLPQAVKDKLIEYGDKFELENLIVEKYRKYLELKYKKNQLNLFFYQENAIKKWKKNNRRLLFQMATGTGKTRTAIGCIDDVLKLHKKLVVIVSCPQGTLSLQWKNEIEKLEFIFDYSIIADGTNRKWGNQFKEQALKISVGGIDNLIVYTTHKTGSQDKFAKLVNIINREVPILFIGDEAHGLGAFKAKSGLLDRYTYRVGLSATPSRWFDEVGSQIIQEYFGDDCFEFTIADALETINPLTGKPFLVNYNYYPEFIELSDEEIEKYENLSNKIIRLSQCQSKKEEYKKIFESLMFQRANIIKNAEDKIDKLIDIISEIKDIKDTIIFVTNEQIDMVMEILQLRKIRAHKLTQQEGTIPQKQYFGKSERQYIIEKFKQGKYQVLVAIKCLDEGIDIPSASTAIIMGSSSNPREFIQRIGRVIRQAEGKNRANIYDSVVYPSVDRIHNQELLKFEKKIFEKEMLRVRDIGSNAINNAEIFDITENILRGLKQWD